MLNKKTLNFMFTLLSRICSDILKVIKKQSQQSFATKINS